MLLNKNKRIDVMSIQGRRRKQLLDDLKERRSYCKLQEEGSTTSHSGRGYGPVVKQATE